MLPLFPHPIPFVHNLFGEIVGGSKGSFRIFRSDTRVECLVDDLITESERRGVCLESPRF